MNNEDFIQNFKEGKIGIFPTDTAYGIGCRIDDASSIDKIYKLRNRPEEKALLALVSSVEMAEEYVNIPEDVKDQLIEKYWPGGLTIIFNCYVDKIPANVRANRTTLAVRWPNHKGLCEIIDKVGVPIVAPSANFSGEPTPLELSEVDTELIESVDFVIEGMCTIKGVSTIVDVTVTPWKVVRKGVIELEIEN